MLQAMVRAHLALYKLARSWWPHSRCIALSRVSHGHGSYAVVLPQEGWR